MMVVWQFSLPRPKSMARPIKMGDVWDSLDAASISLSGAGLGTAYLTSPGVMELPHRGFDDGGIPSQIMLRRLAAWGVHPTGSGKYGDRDKPAVEATNWLMMADVADPGTSVISGVNAIAFYIGGWTPHIWTPQQISAQTVSMMLPIWVYNPNKPGSAQGTTDGNSAVAALKSLRVPSGVRVVIDMETYVDINYCHAFRDVIAANNYLTTIYGSTDFVFGNWGGGGPGGGFWPADWTYVPHMYPHDGVWATQYTDAAHNTQNTSWDQSTVTVLNHLWPHVPDKFTLGVTAQDPHNGTMTKKSAAFTVG